MSTAAITIARRGLTLSPRGWMRSGFVLVTWLGLAASACASWSIVAIDKKTGEVAIAQAICEDRGDLQRRFAVVVPGAGGATVQGRFVDVDRRRLIWHGLQSESTPAEILRGLERAIGPLGNYQLGVVSTVGRSVTYTGGAKRDWAGGRRGRVGSVHYAIQGNLLVGGDVVREAERILRDTDGDLSDRVVAAMLAAALAGGDGRCSCSETDPTGCGSPPPGFDLRTGDFAARSASLLVARPGDPSGECNELLGCANGAYWLDFSAPEGQNESAADPILELVDRYIVWRRFMRDRPDGIRSTATLDHQALPGNGTAPTRLRLTVRDWQEKPVTGSQVEVVHAPDSAGLATIGDLTDHGDGTYTVELTAGAGFGLDRFEVICQDAATRAVVSPMPTLEHELTFFANRKQISAAAGGTVEMRLVGPDRLPIPQTYLILGSLSGTEPGSLVDSLLVPLNFDALSVISFQLRNTKTFEKTYNVFAQSGKSDAVFRAKPGQLNLLVGLDLAFAYLTVDPIDYASNPIVVAIDP